MNRVFVSSTARITSRDRDDLIERLSQAYADGALTLTEFDERSRAAWQAATQADIICLTGDLPVTYSSHIERLHSLRKFTQAWLAISALSLTIWALTCFTTLRVVYPWWLWVVLPAGSVLGVLRFSLHHAQRRI